MKILIFIPILFAGILYLSTKISNGEIVIPQSLDVQERIAYHAKQWGLETSLVKAFAKVESNFNPKARNFEKSPEDYDDSIGLMQITTALAFDCGLIKNYLNPSALEIEWMFDINNNLSVACEYLNYLSKYSFEQMVQSYNVGETGYKKGYRNSDYLKKVKKYYEIYSS